MHPDISHSYLSCTKVYGWTEIFLPDQSKTVWHCHVFPKSDSEFTEWLASSCPSACSLFRFNNGNPFYDVIITEEIDASKFALRWV